MSSNRMLLQDDVNPSDLLDNNKNKTEESTISVPKTMAEALSWDDPYEALMMLSKASSQRATVLSEELFAEMSDLAIEIPQILRVRVDASTSNASGGATMSSKSENGNNKDSPVANSIVCADSILNSLTKIASGGSQASQEIRQLEEEKRDLEQHALDVETALILRKNSDLAAESLSARKYDHAAQAIYQYHQVLEMSRLTNRAKAYAGEYTIQQLDNAHRNLRETLLSQYETAVQNSDLQTLGSMTPLLQQIQLEQEAVALYLRYLQAITNRDMNSNNSNAKDKNPPPYVSMAKVYNSAVATLRHHLPMVSHCLHKANGDAAVVQLVHVQVEKAVIPLFQKYVQDRNLQRLASNAQRVYTLLEERYTAGGGTAAHLTDEGGILMDDDDSADGGDCGFSTQLGSLADVDSSMEEAALCLQHAESYTRFIQHTTREVNKARELRFIREQNEKKAQREREEWATGMSQNKSMIDSKDDQSDPNQKYEPLEILPTHTQLHEIVAEVGGYYSGIERCLLLASMQRAFVSVQETDPDYCRPLSRSLIAEMGNQKTSTTHSVIGSRAQQTSLVETCLYAAKRGTERAFATGHTGTCSAMANFCSDCLGGVLLQVMSQRVEEAGVAKLKPGEGLIVGSAGIFNVSSNLLRQGTHNVVGTVGSATRGKQTKKFLDEAARKRRVQEQIAKACATFNDMEVAVHHTQQLESILLNAVDKGFPPNDAHTEQLRMCVKSLSPVTEGFKAASNDGIESLIAVLNPRIRAIVGEAVGTESSSTSFMGSSVMGVGGGKDVGKVAVRMDYNLTEEAYQLLQLSEGYMARLCALIDELILPLQTFLIPRLWNSLLLGVLGATAKRLEASLRKCHVTALGALSFDSDVRDLLNYAKDRLETSLSAGDSEYALNSNVALSRACVPLARLLQIAKLLNVDDLEDVIDLIASSKRKANWDLKLDESKAFLSLRTEFDPAKVNEFLRIGGGNTDD